MQSYRLFELNEFIRRVLALNLPDPLWIRAEIAQVNESRGHVYLELVEKGADTDEVIAQSPAVIWNGTFRKLRLKLGKDLETLLQEGTEVLVQAKIDFHERYGLKLHIEDIDPAYTLGRLELLRRQLLRQLQEQGLIGLNRQHPLPYALQRIAVVSAITAAGYQDFRQQLRQNPYGFAFRLEFFATAMQGALVETEMLAQLKNIAARKAAFDAVVIIRGGGSRLDLAAFDNLELCKAVAHFPLPVFTGIGHDIDETLLDLVAYQSLKTPTAVAEHLINHNLRFDSALVDAGQLIRFNCQELLHHHNNQLDRTARELARAPQRLLAHKKETFQQLTAEIPLLSRFRIKQESQRLDLLEQLSDLLSLEKTLARGFSLTMKDGKIVPSVRELQPGDQITTRLHDGEVESRVE